jgi:hypothetical protein
MVGTAKVEVILLEKLSDPLHAETDSEENEYHVLDMLPGR